MILWYCHDELCTENYISGHPNKDLVFCMKFYYYIILELNCIPQSYLFCITLLILENKIKQQR